MKESLKAFKIITYLLSGLAILMGLIIVLNPQISAVMSCYLVGGVCIALGISEIIRYFRFGIVGILFRFDFFIGAISILLGMLLIVHPLNALYILPILIGFYIITIGNFSIQSAIEIKRFRAKKWWLLLCIGIMSIICGLLLIVDPFRGANGIMIMIGFSLILTGIERISLLHFISNTISRKKMCSDDIDVEWQEVE